MITKFLLPAIFFMFLSLFVIIGNTIFILKGEWGIWTIEHLGAVIFHGITMIAALFLLTMAVKKQEEE